MKIYKLAELLKKNSKLKSLTLKIIDYNNAKAVVESKEILFTQLKQRDHSLILHCKEEDKTWYSLMGYPEFYKDGVTNTAILFGFNISR